MNKYNRHFMIRWALMLTWTAVAVFLAGTAEAYRFGFAHADPPADDPYLAGKLGFSWSDPIYAGYLIVRGQYIDAPYVVEQRGYGIFVNGVFVENAIDLRMLFPIPEPPPVTEDPGVPAGITRETSIGDALSDPMIGKKHDYWSNKQIWGQDRAKVALEYYAKLPCISKVEQVSPRDIRITDQFGHSVDVEIPQGPPPPDPNPSHEEQYKLCMLAAKRSIGTLKSGQLAFVGNGGYVAILGYPDATSEWREKFNVMAGDMSPEEKTKRLREFDFLGPRETLSTFPLSFRPTPQLWKRLSGDWSWTNDAPARIHALTNGWRVIPPKLGVVPFAKTNAPSVMKSIVATNASAPAAKMPPTVHVENSTPAASPPAPVHKPRHTWPIAAAAIAVLGVLIWLGFNRRS